MEAIWRLLFAQSWLTFHHNPQIKDGLNALVEAITYLTATNNVFHYRPIHKVLGERNFALALSQGK